MLSLLFVLAPFIAVACWWLVMFTGMGEVAEWSTPIWFLLMVASVVYFVLFLLGMVVGLVEFDSIINLEVE